MQAWKIDFCWTFLGDATRNSVLLQGAKAMGMV